ncbi:MAG: hypothetical protein IKT68_04940 [Clostridia bacterium]|nr:hypothetical protein [Clostridia bacterium]
MKRKLGIAVSLICVIGGLYSLIVILLNSIFYTDLTLSTWNYVLLIAVFSAIVACTGLVVYSIKNKTIGRFNSDIFTTIALFFMFMLAFAVPPAIVTNFSTLHAPVGFGPLGTAICHFAKNGVGIYEGFFFVSMISMGFTIGEDDKKHNYDS